MSLKEMQVNQEIERLLVRQDINVRKLTFRYIPAGRRLEMKGELRWFQAGEVKDENEVRRLEMRLLRLDGVDRIRWRLDNWKKTGAGWEHKNQEREATEPQ